MNNSIQAKKLLTCFKYRSGPAALKSLSEGSLYFASPAELNDVLEAKFDSVSANTFIDSFQKTFYEFAINKGYETYKKPIASLSKEFLKVNKDENKRFEQACQKVGIFSA